MEVDPFDPLVHKCLVYLQLFFVFGVGVSACDLITSAEHDLGCLRTLHPDLLLELSANALKLGWDATTTIRVLVTDKDGPFKVHTRT